MMRKFRKIFRPTTTTTVTSKNEHNNTTCTPESPSNDKTIIQQNSPSINNHCQTGRQKNSFNRAFFIFLL